MFYTFTLSLINIIWFMNGSLLIFSYILRVESNRVNLPWRAKWVQLGCQRRERGWSFFAWKVLPAAKSSSCRLPEIDRGDSSDNQEDRITSLGSQHAAVNHIVHLLIQRIHQQFALAWFATTDTGHQLTNGFDTQNSCPPHLAENLVPLPSILSTITPRFLVPRKTLKRVYSSC